MEKVQLGEVCVDKNLPTIVVQSLREQGCYSPLSFAVRQLIIL